MSLPMPFPSRLADVAGYTVDNSAYGDGSSGKLSFTCGTPTNAKKWAVAGWIKVSDDAKTEILIEEYTSASDYATLKVNSGGDIYLYEWDGSNDWGYRFDTKGRDVTGFVPFMLHYDSANATAADRAIMYWGGPDRVPVGTSYGDFALNKEIGINVSGKTMTLFQGEVTSYNAAYEAQRMFFDGTLPAWADVFEQDVNTGNWKAKDTSDLTYGNNGSLLDFADSGTLGNDAATGGTNDWTKTGTITQSTDTPTNNHATLNAVWPSAAYLSDGNTSFTPTVNNRGAISTLMIPEGGHYSAECYIHTNPSTDTILIGVNVDGVNLTATRGGKDTGYSYTDGALKDILGTQSAYGVTYGVGDTITVDVNRSTNTLTLYKNGASQGTLTSSLPATGNLFFWVGIGGGSSTNGVSWVFDHDNFAYTVPSGSSPLITDGLPAMTATETEQGVSAHWNTVTYTAPGGTTSITGLGFQPDFIWIKERGAVKGHAWFDSARGPEKLLGSDVTTAEWTSTSSVTSFNADGWTMGDDGYVNNLSDTYVAWCARLENEVTSGWGGSPDITPSKEIYNATLGMSIVTYTGSGVNGDTIPHSLGVKPGLIIIKRLDTTQNWLVYNSTLGATKYLLLQLTDAAATGSTMWNDTEPTSQLITLGTYTGLNDSGGTGTYVAYIFAESDFIKIGSYEGNANADGPFITNNTRPVWSLFKKIDVAGDWILNDEARDPGNACGQMLHPNKSLAEYSGDAVDYVGSGVKWRNAGYANTNTAIYMTIGQPTGASGSAEATGR